MTQTTFVNESQKSNWMVIYTRSRFEKKTTNLLNDKGYVAFCPLVKYRKKWADRIKTVENPLFPSYIFVKARHSELQKIKETQGVIMFVSNCGKAITLKDSEIERIKSIVNNYSDAEIININDLGIGSKVKIIDGLLLNYQGIVTRIKGKTVLMTVEQLNCVIAVNVNIDQISINSAS